MILLYVDQLVDDGYLPYRVEEDDEEEEPPEANGLTLAQRAAADESDNEEDSEDTEDTEGDMEIGLLEMEEHMWRSKCIGAKERDDGMRLFLIGSDGYEQRQ